MLKLHNISKFSQDLSRYKEAAEKITQPAAKMKMNNLIMQFEKYAQLINEAHNSYSNGYIAPKQQKEYVLEMSNLRILLDKFVNDIN